MIPLFPQVDRCEPLSRFEQMLIGKLDTLTVEQWNHEYCTVVSNTWTFRLGYAWVTGRDGLWQRPWGLTYTSWCQCIIIVFILPFSIWWTQWGWKYVCGVVVWLSYWFDDFQLVLSVVQSPLFWFFLSMFLHQSLSCFFLNVMGYTPLVNENYLIFFTIFFSFCCIIRNCLEWFNNYLVSFRMI